MLLVKVTNIDFFTQKSSLPTYPMTNNEVPISSEPVRAGSFTGRFNRYRVLVTERLHHDRANGLFFLSSG